MQTSEKILATFRIEKDKWEAFKEKSGNATDALSVLIDAYLRDFDPNTYVMADRLAALERRVAKLEKNQ